MDWQAELYIELPEIDMFQCKEDEVLRHRLFADKIYRRKQFDKLDLHGARFKNCVFESCAFTENCLNDVIFKNCIFKKTDICGGTMYGATFQNCSFVRSDIVDAKQEQTEFEPEEFHGFYREVTFINCTKEDE